MNLESKVAVITGGTKGIGFAIAESLVKAGASVSVCSRTYSDVEQAVASLLGPGTGGGEAL